MLSSSKTTAALREGEKRFRANVEGPARQPR